MNELLNWKLIRTRTNMKKINLIASMAVVKIMDCSIYEKIKDFL